MSNESNNAATAATAARVRRPQLEDINAEMIAFLPDSVVIRGALYYRVCWIYAGEGDKPARVGYGWAHNYSAVPQWATPCGSARRGAFILGGVTRRGPTSTSRHGWDLLIDSISETGADAEGRAE